MEDYNTARPHQALDMATAAQRFRVTPLAKGRVSVPVDAREVHRGQWVLRRVGSNGVVSVDNQLFSVTNAYRGELVDVFVDGRVIRVWSKNHLIRTVARTREGRSGRSELMGYTSTISRSPSRSFRTICSGVCFLPFIVPPGRVGRGGSLIPGGPVSGGQVTLAGRGLGHIARSVWMTPAPLQLGQAPSELALESAGFTPLAFAIRRADRVE